MWFFFPVFLFLTGWGGGRGTIQVTVFSSLQRKQLLSLSHLPKVFFDFSSKTVIAQFIISSYSLPSAHFLEKYHNKKGNGLFTILFSIHSTLTWYSWNCTPSADISPFVSVCAETEPGERKNGFQRSRSKSIQLTMLSHWQAGEHCSYQIVAFFTGEVDAYGHIVPLICVWPRFAEVGG